MERTGGVGVTPHEMMGYYLGLRPRIFYKVKIHKYTHINNKLSDLNIRYYKFSSNFDT
jgi:hypothetical protein